MNKIFKTLAIISVAASITSCTSTRKTIREPYSRVDFTKGDFIFSEQLTGQAKTTKVLGFDFPRWFNRNNGATVAGDNSAKIGVSSIPVVGSYLSDKSASYALYDILQKNPGYDVVFYPQYSTRVQKPILGIGFIYKKVTVTANAKLARLKP